jgi:hypothetical protein
VKLALVAKAGLLGAAPPCSAGGYDIEQSAKRPVDSVGVWERGGYVGIEHHDVGSLSVPGYVLTPDTAAEVILGPHGVSICGAVGSLPHTSVSLGGSPAVR